MEQVKYQNIVDKHKPKESKIQNLFISFVSGGLVGILGQLLVEFYIKIFSINFKDATSIMLITIIFLGSLFTALGFYDKLVNFCKCGLIIPISGFAHSITSCAIEYKREGYILGLGTNLFKLAGSVILYGIVSSWFFGIIRLLIGV